MESEERGLVETLSGEYYGRIILLGRAISGENVVGYALTGRSLPSRQRVLHKRGDGVIMTFPTNLKSEINPEKPLSEEAKAEIRANGGNPALLIYDAIIPQEQGIVVSNGAQTNLIASTLLRRRFEDMNSLNNLEVALDVPMKIEGVDITSFEPDAPNYTPRISGISSYEHGVLSIIRKEEGMQRSRSFKEFPLEKGKGKIISTYSGKNVPKGVPIPIFRGEPMDVLIEGTSPKAVAQSFYDALGPKTGEGILQPGDDFRAAVTVSFFHPQTNNLNYSHIINASETRQV